MILPRRRVHKREPGRRTIVALDSLRIADCVVNFFFFFADRACNSLAGMYNLFLRHFVDLASSPVEIRIQTTNRAKRKRKKRSTITNPPAALIVRRSPQFYHSTESDESQR